MSKYHSERDSLVWEVSMCRWFADRLAVATGIDVVLVAVVLALLRAGG